MKVSIYNFSKEMIHTWKVANRIYQFVLQARDWEESRAHADSVSS